jgi:hypothetical protein
MKPHKRNGREAKIRRQQAAIWRAQNNDNNTKMLKAIFGKKETDNG